MIVELAYPSLLYGVSQQTPRERQNGQLTEQLNMLSDPVTGIRRRPGLIKAFELESNGDIDWTKVWSQYMEVGNLQINLVVFTTSGKWLALDKQMKTLISSGQTDYFKASSASAIRATSNTNLGWVLNTEQKPKPLIGGADYLDDTQGYLTIRTGAFLKEYAFRIEGKYNGVAFSQDISYTTPSGSASGDAAKSTPEGVAKELYTKIHGISNLQPTREGSNIFIRLGSSKKDGDWLGITNKSGGSYASTSTRAKVKNVSELPASLPSVADNWIVKVGTSTAAMQYYEWDHSTLSWNECSKRSSVHKIQNMPVQITLDNEGGIIIKAVDFEGKGSGDEANNPTPAYVYDGITGIGTFMGRLVLMSGSRVCLSASRYPTRTMRSTVTEVLDDDPFEVASGSISSASFEHSVQFNKDLILFASTHQAVIPTGNVAITPANAMLVITSEENVDTNARPAVVGQTLMYASKPSGDYFGVGELTPSAYTSSVYTPQSLTDHIPKMMQGSCRHIVCASNSNIVYFTSNKDPYTVYVCEYFWNNQERTLISFHEWKLPGRVCAMHYTEDKVCVVLDAAEDGNHCLICSIDTKTAQYLTQDTVVFLDCAQDVPVNVSRTSQATTKTIEIPPHLQGTKNREKLVLASLTAGLVGEPIGISSINGNTITIDSSYKTDKIMIGWCYESAVTPNSPVVYSTAYTTGNRRMISDTKDALQSALITVQRSGNFYVTISDVNTSQEKYNHTGLTWSARELDLGKNKISKIGDILVPCRLNAHTAEIRLSTSGTKEMNILSLVYNVRLHHNRNRKQY